MKNIYFNIFIISTCLFGSFLSCKDSGIPITGNVPQISFVCDTLVADLNKATNVPIVAVISSEVGLTSVAMSIEKTNGESVLYKEDKSFFDSKQYSLTERPLYEENFKNFKVIATDKAGKSTSTLIPFKIIGYKNAPIVKFELASIVINEMNGDITPRTKFNVTASTNLKSLVVSRYFKNETPQVLLTENFIDNAVFTTTYSYNDSIIYTENDIAIQVTAVDAYGKSKIETLQITYTSIPVPAISNLNPAKFTVDVNATANLGFTATSLVGVMQIKLIAMHKTLESTELSSIDYPAFDKNVTFSKSLTFSDEAMSGIKIVVTDKNNKKVEKIVSAAVGLDYIADQWLGSQFYTRGIPEEPGVYGMYSLKLKQGISIYDAYTTPSNVDFLFYMYDQASGTAAARFLSPLIPSDAGRYKNGPWYIDLMHTPSIPYFDAWTGLNATKYLQLDATAQGFTFDNATLADLKKIVKSTINLERLRGTTVPAEKIEAGYVYLFKTGVNSSAGSEKIGLFKIEELKYFSTMPAVTHTWGTAGKVTEIGKLRITIKMPK